MPWVFYLAHFLSFLLAPTAWILLWRERDLFLQIQSQIFNVTEEKLRKKPQKTLCWAI